MTAAIAQKADTQGGFKLYTVEELESLPEPAWLIEGVLPQGALAELYGPPGVGKSFLALDWTLSVAANVPWLGHKLNQADVVYVSAEGGSGLKNRIAAWWAKHPGADLSPFRVLLHPVNMLVGKNVNALIESAQMVQCSPSLVVIDTLARCFGDGDENAAVDMNRFVKGTDLIKGTFPQATVLVVHHTGKDARRKDRGSTVLRAAADTMMELTATGGSKALTLTCEKQKDWDLFKDIRLSLRVVMLEDSETSCVIGARKVLLSPSGPVGNGSDAKALDALRTGGVAGMIYSQWRDASDLPASTFKTARKRLLRDGLIHREGTLYRVTETNEGQGQGQGQTGSKALAS